MMRHQVELQTELAVDLPNVLGDRVSMTYRNHKSQILSSARSASKL